MHKYERIVRLAVVAVLLGGVSAHAESRCERGCSMGRMGGQGMGVALLLAGIPAVQKEIGLEGEGAEKVQKLLDSFREEMMAETEKAGLGFGGFGQFADLKPEER